MYIFFFQTFSTESFEEAILHSMFLGADTHFKLCIPWLSTYLWRNQLFNLSPTYKFQKLPTNFAVTKNDLGAPLKVL